MSVGLVPAVGEVAMLNSVLAKSGGLTDPLTLFLFSNNFTPDNATVFGDLTVVSGGGYVSIALDKDDFTVTPGDPSQALYDSFQDFNFTGAISGSGNVYGYGIRDAASLLIAVERFDAFLTPSTGSLIRIRPRIRFNSPPAV